MYSTYSFHDIKDRTRVQGQRSGLVYLNLTGRRGDFPRGLVDKTLPSNAGNVGLIPSQGTKIPYVLGPKEPQNKTGTTL